MARSKRGDAKGGRDRGAHRAAAAGAKVTELTLPPVLEDAYQAQYTIQDYENVRALAFEYDRHRDRIDPLLRDHLTAALTITSDQYDAARRTASRGRQALADARRISTSSSPRRRRAPRRRDWAPPAIRCSTGCGR